jgi:hypothetical protein
MSEHHIVWNAASSEWICTRCLRTSDHVNEEDAERELSQFQCVEAKADGSPDDMS